MDRVFSVDDITDQFWLPPPMRLSSQVAAEEDSSSSASATASSKMMMNRSMSEWALQRFIQEIAATTASESSTPSSSSSRAPIDVVEIKDHDQPTSGTAGKAAAAAGISTSNVAALPGGVAAGPPNVPIDSEEYQAYLKSRLNLACAAVALTRASSIRPQDAATLPDKGLQASDTSLLVPTPSKASAYDSQSPMGQEKDVSGPVGIPSLPVVQKKSAVQVKSTTSGSSREQSDDDDLDTETTENMDPADVKRVRRMLSNRESARRSRRRKQAHLTELQTQVSQLMVENSSLSKRLTEIIQKYNDAAVDNRVLKADVETMRAKVKMAEEAVKRVTGLNPLFQAMSDISTMGMPQYACSPPVTLTDAAVPVQDGLKQHQQQQPFYQPAPNNHISSSNHDPRIHQNGLEELPAVEESGAQKMGRSASMQRVASLEHLQKRIRGGVSSSENHGNGEQ